VIGLSLGALVLQSVGGGLSTVTATVTALAGAFVAYQGYRGYRRNDSPPMLYLAIGILLLTTVSLRREAGCRPRRRRFPPRRSSRR